VRPRGFRSSSRGRFLLPWAWHFNRSPARKTDRVVVLTELRTRETHNLSRLGERDDSPCGILEPARPFAGQTSTVVEKASHERRVQVMVPTTANVARRLIVGMSGECFEDAAHGRSLAVLMARFEGAEIGNAISEIVPCEAAAMTEPAP